MDAFDFDRVKLALLDALSRSESERARWLASLEREEPGLAAEVRSLLDHEMHPLPEIDDAWVRRSLEPLAGATTPDRLGPYPIEAELGRGGTGIVYLAHDTELDRKIALKVLPPYAAGRPGYLDRLRSEARLLASVAHPNIATIHGLHTDYERPFLSLEFVEGGTLADRLQAGPLDLDAATRMAQQIALALEAAHARGVVHHDLKPANVMLTSTDMVKVVDFGLAGRSTESSREEGDGDAGVSRRDRSTRTGTPGYMSPEQITGASVDRRADIWAFGCVFFECLTGVAVSGSGSLEERLQRTLDGRLPWEALPPGVSPRVRAILDDCLAVRAEDRRGSISSVRQDLDEELLQRSLSELSWQSTAPPLACPNNLPGVFDTFFGHRDALADVAARLRTVPLLTLVGAGGCGKTRLALETARRVAPECPGGAWFVDLAPVRVPEGVASETARALGIAASGSEDPLGSVISFVGDQRMLLILDNCEHLRDAVGEFCRQLIGSLANLRLLATSREALGVAGEVCVTVQPLNVGDARPDGTAATPPPEGPPSEAAQLFLDRAASMAPGFDAATADPGAVSRICRRLEGNPLALELAAARVRVLSVEEIATRLADRFSLLDSASTRAPASTGLEPSADRHRSLYASIEWTHQLLSETEQAVFRRLALFQGGWTLDAAEAVCQGGALAAWDVLPAFVQLVEKSLVQRVENGTTRERSRYRLFETIREFALDRLRQAGEEDEVALRQAGYFLELAEESQRQINGSEQARWVARLDEETANMRQALALTLNDGRDPSIAMRIAAALGDYWQIRGAYREAAEVYEAALADPHSHEDTQVRARLLTWAGNIALARGQFDRSRAFHEESVTTCERIGHQRGLGSSINSLGVLAWKSGDVAQARVCYERAARIWADVGESRLVGITLNNLGVLDMETGDYASARTHFENSLALQEELGNRHAVGVLRANIGLSAMHQGAYEDARSAFQNSLSVRRELGDRSGIAHCLNGLGGVLERQGDPAAAKPFFEESLAIYEEIGESGSAAIPLINLGFVGHHLDAVEEAAGCFARAHRLAENSGDHANAARATAGLGMIALKRGDLAEATRLLQDGISGFQAVADRWGMTLVLEQVADLFLKLDAPRRAARTLGFLEAERAAIHAPRTVLQQSDHERMVRALRERLGEDGYGSEFVTGESATIAQLIELTRAMEAET